MKKSLLLLLFIPHIINAQFSLTKDGFVSTEDTSKNFVVYSIDDASKEKLYANVLKYLTTTYKSAKDVLSKVDNEVITINAMQPKYINAKTLKYDIRYTLTIHFKDGRIKIDAPEFECTTRAYNKPYRLAMSGSNAGLGSEVVNGLFKKDGEPGLKKTVIEIENFFNTLSTNIAEAAEGNTNSNDDW